jgi:hypothetical protein
MERFGTHFGEGTSSHQRLVGAIEAQIAEFSVVAGPTKRNWGSVVLAVLIGIPSGYVAWELNSDGFDIWSVPVGFLAFVMLIAVWGLIFPSEEDESDEA